jgi:hypothetical protein
MLAFSSKFPATLQRTASLLHTKADYSGNLKQASLIARLTADSRLDAAWNELTKRARSNHKPTLKFSRPASPPSYAAAMSAEEAQMKALQELFCEVVLMVEYHRPFSSLAGARVAHAILKEASSLRNGNSRKSKSKANQLSKAATAIVSLVQPDPAREIALELNTYFEERFRSPMYGTTAVIVSVALERNVTRAMVRNWYAASVLKGGQNDQLVAHS